MIDTTAGSAEVTLSFSVSDDSSGATYFEAVFVEASGVSHRSASGNFGPALSGSYTAKIAFPRFSAPGVWRLSGIFLSDAAGNSLLLDAEGIRHRGFPNQLQVTSAHDEVKPTIKTLRLAPSSIDTSLADVDVKVDYSVTDDLSGVCYLELNFVSPSGIATRKASAKFDPTVSASDSMTINFPRHSEPGRWILAGVLVADAAGNTLTLDSNGISSLGFPTALQVKSDPDTTPPNLVSLQFVPHMLDTTQGPAPVDVTFRATDRESGIKSIELTFVSPSGIAKQTGALVFPSLHGITDSMKVIFPAHSAPGPWMLRSVFLVDAANNTLNLDEKGLAGMGVNTALEVR